MNGNPEIRQLDMQRIATLKGVVLGDFEPTFKTLRFLFADQPS